MSNHRGRHRKPSYTGRKLAALGAAFSIPAIVSAPSAVAATPDWGPIIKCESGGNPNAQNASSTASGLFQFINGTWAAYGGLAFAPTAKQATVSEQYTVANRAFADAGYSPWNASKACWSGKLGSGVKAEIKVNLDPLPAAKAGANTRAKSIPVPVKPIVVGKPTSGGTGTYEVKPGDTLTNIAAAHNIDSWTTVYEANREIVEHPDWIWPGERLSLSDTSTN